jgi:hypothetical protein
VSSWRPVTWLRQPTTKKRKRKRKKKKPWKKT